MSDSYSIDGHKLSFHPERVSRWHKAENNWNKLKKTYPIYLEIAPVGSCNHRCTFCSVDYVGYKNIRQNENLLSSRIREVSKLGVKSIMFAGEGEPTLWKPLANILDTCTEEGIDTALTTNAVAFTKNTTENYVKNCKWIKVSINAGTSDCYAKIHQTKKEDFNKVIDNLSLAVKIKKEKNYQCTIGSQILLLPENKDTVIQLAKTVKEIGVDYLVVKPYTQSLYGISRRYESIEYDNMMYLADELKLYESNNFSIIFRENTMKKLEESQQPYKKCYSTPFFWSYIMADGSVYGCGAYLENEKFYYGNINEQSFQEIWEGEKRKRSFAYIQNDLDIADCRKNCRMDEVNRYLWSLKNPSSHTNFI